MTPTTTADTPEPDAPIGRRERVTLWFANSEQYAFYDLMLRFGFGFSTTSKFEVGRVFENPDRGLRVELDETPEELRAEDGLYQPRLMVRRRYRHTSAGAAIAAERSDYDVPCQGTHYSDIEWAWITEANTTEGVLERELYIWVKVRPRSLNTPAIERAERTLQRPPAKQPRPTLAHSAS